MVDNSPTIEEVMPEINNILKRYDKIVGYNVRFDADFLKHNGAEFADNTNFVDSMKIFSLYFSADNKRCSLLKQLITSVMIGLSMKRHTIAWEIAMPPFMYIRNLLPTH